MMSLYAVHHFQFREFLGTVYTAGTKEALDSWIETHPVSDTYDSYELVQLPTEDEDGKSLGWAEYQEKPYTGDVLRAIVHDLVGRRPIGLVDVHRKPIECRTPRLPQCSPLTLEHPLRIIATEHSGQAQSCSDVGCEEDYFHCKCGSWYIVEGSADIIRDKVQRGEARVIDSDEEYQKWLSLARYRTQSEEISQKF